MADHRRTPALQRLLAQFSLRGVSAAVRAALVLQLSFFTIAAPALFILEGHIFPAIVMALLGVFGSAVEVWLAAERQREMTDLSDRRTMLDDYEAALRSLQAVTPDGAPTRAYWTAHCGCTHVNVWDGVGWAREHVAELNSNCPLVEAYGRLGGQGV